MKLTIVMKAFVMTALTAPAGAMAAASVCEFRVSKLATKVVQVRADEPAPASGNVAEITVAGTFSVANLSGLELSYFNGMAQGIASRRSHAVYDVKSQTFTLRLSRVLADVFVSMGKDGKTDGQLSILGLKASEGKRDCRVVADDAFVTASI